jgi:hypothetical protein
MPTMQTIFCIPRQPPRFVLSATLALRLEAMRRRSGWQMGLGFMPAAAVNSGSTNIHRQRNEMKIVSINRAPTVCNADGAIRPTVTSLDAIVANIDTCNGRNDALRAYIFALRDLQVANNEFGYADVDRTTEEKHAATSESRRGQGLRPADPCRACS